MVPRALIRSRAERNAMSPVIVVWFENKKRAILIYEFEQIDRASLPCRLPIGDTSSPRYRLTKRFLFALRKPILMHIVGEHLKRRLLVHDFASERIHETNVVVHVCAGEWMRIVVAGEEFVDEYSFVNKIYAEAAAASQLAALIFEVVWRTDDGGNTMLREMIPQ